MPTLPYTSTIQQTFFIKYDKKVVIWTKVITRNRDVDFVSVAPFEVNDEKLSMMKILWMLLHVIFHVKISHWANNNN